MGEAMKLPEHVTMEDGTPTCMHCGGRVDAKGYAEGGEVQDDSEKKREAPQETPAARLYAAARKLREGRR